MIKSKPKLDRRMSRRPTLMQECKARSSFRKSSSQISIADLETLGRKKSRKSSIRLQAMDIVPEPLVYKRGSHRGRSQIENTFRARFWCNIPHEGFWTAFIEACESSKDRWVTLKGLMLCYSLPQQINATDISGESMMSLASQHGRTKVLELLKEIRGDLSLLNHKEWTPVHVAVAYQQPASLAKLKELDVSLDSRGKGMGFTPAHLAAQANDVKMLKALMDLEADLTIPSNTKLTLLHTAAEFDCLEAVKYLISIGLNVNAVDQALETPAHKAARAGNSRVIDTLVRHGAMMHVENLDGDNPVDLANASGWFQT